MSLLYNIGITLYEGAINIASHGNHKAKLWCEGRRGLLDAMASRIKGGERIVWIHAASLGEFEQGRPIIERIRAEIPESKILLTFFSPSGYEIRKGYTGADYIFYLPSDRPKNVRRFLDIVRPEIAIFIKYEFWLNYLSELHRRDITTYLISAIFRPRSVFFRPWGGAWRKALATFDTLFVQNNESKRLLKEIGIERVVLAGDTRFDRVAEIARKAPRIELVERFKGNDRLFVAGSTWEADEELLIELMNNNPDVRFLIAPHEMDERRIAHIMDRTKGGAKRYTQSTIESDLSHTQTLILDTIGILSSAYSYAYWAYIGGGFGHGIHNTLEAATFGLPMAFGPNYHKFQEACDMVTRGIATGIKDGGELGRWFTTLKNDTALYAKLRNEAKAYTQSNCGATDLIIEKIRESL